MKKIILGVGQIQNGVCNDFNVYLITILNKIFMGKRVMRIKDSAKSKSVFFMYKEDLLKIWGGYGDLFQNGSLSSFDSEKPVFFHEITKISARKLELEIPL